MGGAGDSSPLITEIFRVISKITFNCPKEDEVGRIPINKIG
jgi:hypothetical protein